MLEDFFGRMWSSNTTDEIVYTTDEVERISKTHFLKEVSEVVLGLQNCSVAFMDAKNGFLAKFHIEMVVQKKSQLFFFIEKNIFENEKNEKNGF